MCGLIPFFVNYNSDFHGHTHNFSGGGIFNLVMGHREGLYSAIWRVYIGEDYKFKPKKVLPVTQIPLFTSMDFHLIYYTNKDQESRRCHDA